MQPTSVVANDVGEDDQTAHEIVRVGNGHVANLAADQGGPLCRVFRLELTRTRRNFNLFVKFLFVSERKGDFVRTLVKGQGLVGKDKKTELANCDAVVPGRQIFQKEAADVIRQDRLGQRTVRLAHDGCKQNFRTGHRYAALIDYFPRQRGRLSGAQRTLSAEQRGEEKRCRRSPNNLHVKRNDRRDVTNFKYYFT